VYYVYVLHSKADDNWYIGCTNDLRQRVLDHEAGLVKSTQRRLPVELIYYEACRNKKDAYRRERYLKTSYGHRYLRNRLRHYFTG
jgi:putative endonuclease